MSKPCAVEFISFVIGMTYNSQGIQQKLVCHEYICMVFYISFTGNHDKYGCSIVFPIQMIRDVKKNNVIDAWRKKRIR